MARTIQVTAPPDQTVALVELARQTEGVAGVRLERGGSLVPPGDVLTVDATNRATHELLRAFDARGLGRLPGTSVTTAEPYSVVAPASQDLIDGDANDATWEEMSSAIRASTNMRANALLLMAGSGVLAAVGLATDAVELVIAAMVIAPEFQPLVQTSLGLVSRSAPTARAGAGHVGAGWLTMAASALVTAFALDASGQDPLGGGGAYLPAGSLVSYFTTISGTTLATDAAAATAGAVLIASRRTTLTAGVSIALPLVPLTALAGVALAAGETDVLRLALTRWVLDAAIVVAAGAAVLSWKRATVLHRSMMP